MCVCVCVFPFERPVPQTHVLNCHEVRMLLRPSCLSEAASVYEVKVVAFNGNGESGGSGRLVLLGDQASSSSDGEPPGSQIRPVSPERSRSSCFGLRVFAVRRNAGVPVRRRRGVPGERGPRHPHRHGVHHLLRPPPGVWVPPQVSPASSSPGLASPNADQAKPAACFQSLLQERD